MAKFLGSTKQVTLNAGTMPVPAVIIPAGATILVMITIDVSGYDLSNASMTGFTKLAHLQSGSPDLHTQILLGKIADGTENTDGSSGNTIAIASSGDVHQAIAVMAVFDETDGVLPTNIVSTHNTSNNSTPVTATMTGLTAAANSAIFVGIAGDRTDNSAVWEFSDITDYTTREQEHGGTHWCDIEVFTRDEVSAGATGNLTSTLTRTFAAGGTGFGGWVVEIPSPKAAYLTLEILNADIRDSSAANLLQLGEFKAYNGATEVSIVSSTGNANSANLIDGSSSTKAERSFEGSTTGIGVSYTFYLGSGIPFVDSYTFTTANDVDARDPVTWYLWGGKDSTERVLLDYREDQDAVVPTARQTETPKFTFDNDLITGEIDVSTAGTDPYPYKHFTFPKARIRDTGQDNIQVSEAVFFSGGMRVIPIAVTQSAGQHNVPSDGEGSEKIYDDDPSTKWFDKYATGPRTETELVFQFDPSVIVDRYRLITGNDADGRDPLGWIVGGSTDGALGGGSYEYEDVAANTANTTTQRRMATPDFDMTPPATTVEVIGTPVTYQFNPGGGTSEYTISATIPADCTGVLVEAYAPTTPDVEGITVNGVSMTEVTGTRAGSTLLSRMVLRGGWWFLPSPATGAQDIVIDFDDEFNTHYAAVVFIKGNATTGTMFEGGDSSALEDAVASMSIAPTTTTVAGDLLIGTSWTSFGSNSTSDTELINTSHRDMERVTAYEIPTGAGATLDFDNGGTRPYAFTVFVIKAASGGATTTDVSIAATQADDVGSVTVAQDNAAAITATQADDVADIDVDNQATADVAIDATQAGDVGSVTVAQDNAVAITATQADDVAAITVTPDNQTDITATQADDTASIAITNVETTDVAIDATQADNVGDITVEPYLNVSMAITQGADVGDITVAQDNQIDITATQEGDIASINLGGEVEVSIAGTQAGDTADVTVTQDNAVTVTATQADDVGAIAVAFELAVSIAAAQADDVADVTVTAPNYVGIDATQADNIASILVSIDGAPVGAGGQISTFRRYPRR